MHNRYFLSLLILLTSFAFVAEARGQQTATLYAPNSRGVKNYGEGRAWFSFEYGVVGKAEKAVTGDQWDLMYGFMSMGGEDWLAVSHIKKDDRSRIKDLGELNWSDYFEVPVIEPLPPLEDGQQRSIIVRRGAKPEEDWKQNSVWVKAIVGHMYVVRIKDDDSDAYALFRVEELTQGERCTISWRLIPAPEK